MLKIAIDVMGGDFAPISFIEALQIYFDSPNRKDKIKFLLYGEKKQIINVCEKISFSLEKDIIEIFDFPGMPKDQRPTSVLRQKEDTSMSAAIKAVENGKADIVVSGGDTGAYMILCMKILKLNDNLKRPALVKSIKALNNRNVIMLDLGANSDPCDIDMWNLAKIGYNFSKEMFNISKPVVKLLNIGEEKHKGNLFLKKVADKFDELSKNEDINYQGFIESSKIMFGESDVIVSDGFSGNIAIKSLSGGIKFVIDKVKNNCDDKMFKQLAELIDPRENNGAMFLGLKKGIAIKSHGASDGFACYNALKLALNCNY